MQVDVCTPDSACKRVREAGLGRGGGYRWLLPQGLQLILGGAWAEAALPSCPKGKQGHCAWTSHWMRSPQGQGEPPPFDGREASQGHSREGAAATSPCNRAADCTTPQPRLRGTASALLPLEEKPPSLLRPEASSCPAVNGASREENTVAGPRGASPTPAVRPERPRRWGSRESAPRCPHRHLFPWDATSDHFYLQLLRPQGPPVLSPPLGTLPPPLSLPEGPFSRRPSLMLPVSLGLCGVLYRHAHLPFKEFVE